MLLVDGTRRSGRFLSELANSAGILWTPEEQKPDNPVLDPPVITSGNMSFLVQVEAFKWICFALRAFYLATLPRNTTIHR